MSETLACGTHLRVLSVSFLMNTNMVDLDGFGKSLCHCPLDESSCSNKRVKVFDPSAP